MSKTTVLTKCPLCGEEKKIEVEETDYLRYTETKALTQDCFPYLSRADRERLITGICEECGRKMFGDDEDE